MALRLCFCADNWACSHGIGISSWLQVWPAVRGSSRGFLRPLSPRQSCCPRSRHPRQRPHRSPSLPQRRGNLPHRRMALTTRHRASSPRPGTRKSSQGAPGSTGRGCPACAAAAPGGSARTGTPSASAADGTARRTGEDEDHVQQLSPLDPAVDDVLVSEGGGSMPRPHHEPKHQTDTNQ